MRTAISSIMRLLLVVFPFISRLNTMSCSSSVSKHDLRRQGWYSSFRKVIVESWFVSDSKESANMYVASWTQNFFVWRTEGRVTAVSSAVFEGVQWKMQYVFVGMDLIVDRRGLRRIVVRLRFLSMMLADWEVWRLKRDVRERSEPVIDISSSDDKEWDESKT